MKNWLLTKELRHPFLIAFSCTLVAALVRLKVRFTHPFLWGEDGADFFFQLLCLGQAGIFKPVVEQLMPLQRIIAWTNFKLSPIYFAELLVFSSLLFFSLCSSYIAKASFRSLIPSDCLRVVMASALPLAPASFEILGNLTATSTYPFVWLICLMVVELFFVKVNFRHAFWTTIAVSINSLSFLSLPLLIINWTKTQSRLRYVILVASLLPLLFAMQRVSTSNLPGAHLTLSRISDLPTHVVTAFLTYSILNPFLGAPITDWLLGEGRTSTVLVGVLTLFVILLLALKSERAIRVAITVWIVPMIYAAAHILTRSASIDPIDIGKVPAFGRINFLFFASSMLVAFSFVRGAKNVSGIKAILMSAPLVLFLVVLLPSTLKGFSIGYGEYERSWSEFKPFLLKTDDESVWEKRIYIYPTDIRDGKVFSWATMKVVKSRDLLRCEFSGGNTGNEVLITERGLIAGSNQ